MAHVLELRVLLYCFLTVIAAGLVAASRLYLGKHNPSQAYAGIILGFFISYLSMLVF
jgi:membrane-associated phospholipid phosphatase